MRGRTADLISKKTPCTAGKQDGFSLQLVNDAGSIAKPPPLVLAIGGHDPSGGAGLQADIETCAALGCRALTVVTALTTQNTCGVTAIHAQPPQQILHQCCLLRQESQIAAIKIGLLASAAIAETVANLLADFGHLPVILDPVLAAGSGQSFADAALIQVIIEQLCPRCTLITPNSLEARTLTGLNDLTSCAAALIARGCTAALITGGHELESNVINRLYNLDGCIDSREWPRLAASYHGSGCTLATAITAELAHGQPLLTAVNNAQSYTWHALNQALCTGHCQLTPNRFYAWSR